MVFAVAVTGGYGILLVHGLVLLAVEAPGRARALIPALVTLAVAVLAAAPVLAPASPLIILCGAFAVASVTILASRIALPAVRREPLQPWVEAAAVVALLAAAALVVTGLHERNPLLAVLGVFFPAILPALLQHRTEVQAPGLRVRALAQAVAAMETTTMACDLGLEKATAQLHRILAPQLGHRVTVVAVNPATGLLDEAIAAYPMSPIDLALLRGRVRHLFTSRRANEVNAPTLTAPGDTAHIDPELAISLLVPVRHGSGVVALIALLGDRPPVSADLVEPLAEALGAVIEHLLEGIERHRRLQTVEQRLDEQGRRLRHLLQLSQVIYTASDLRTACNNLTRAISLGFGFAWAGFFMRRPGGSLRLTATFPVEETPAADVGGPQTLAPDALAAALELGASLSRCSVVPTRAWPLPLPGDRQADSLLILPLGNDHGELGVLVCLPTPALPVPDPEDLRALEILLDQVAPVIASTAHLEELHRQTLLDGLTGVANRRSLDLYLERALAEVAERGRCASLAMLDIDDFKAVNDRFGHRVGDVALRELAALLVKNLRTLDFIARYGGEEFCMVLPGLDAARAVAVLRRILETIATTPFATAELSHPLRLTVSMGVATYPDDGADLTELLDRADMALYRAKAEGKNRVVWSALLTDEPFFGSDEPFTF